MAGPTHLAPPRAAWLALSALGLAACASLPIPMLAPPPGDETPSEPEESLHSDAPPRVLGAGARVQCVPFARRASGIEIYGNASTWWRQAEGRYPRSRSPAPGSVLVMRGYRNESRGHVAVVSEIVSARLIRVDQANWLNAGEISIGAPVMDVSPNNDWSHVRVWHIPGGHWGARIYAAHGFIHAFSPASDGLSGRR